MRRAARAGAPVAGSCPCAAKLKDGVLLGDLLKGLDPQLDLTGFNRRVLSRGAALTNLEIVLGAVWRKSAIGMGTWRCGRDGAHAGCGCPRARACACAWLARGVRPTCQAPTGPNMIVAGKCMPSAEELYDEKRERVFSLLRVIMEVLLPWNVSCASHYRHASTQRAMTAVGRAGECGRHHREMREGDCVPPPREETRAR